MQPVAFIGGFALALFSLPTAAIAQGGAVLEFDGSDDRVTVPYDASFPTEVFTVAAWVKLSPPGHNSAIIARGEDDNSWDLTWQLYVTPDGDLNLMVEDTAMNNFCYPFACFSRNVSPTCSIKGAMFIADDEWHHVAATRAVSGEFAMYIDGFLQASCTVTGVPSVDNFQDLTIGCTHGYLGPPPGGIEPPTWFLPGQIDEPAMWDTALSAEQVELVHVSGPTAMPTGLVGFWTFDEGEGQVVADLSPAANHGFRGAESASDSADPVWIIIDVACTGDLSGDGTVGTADLLALLSAWGQCGKPCDADLDDDGVVATSDLLSLLSQWGPCV